MAKDKNANDDGEGEGNGSDDAGDQVDELVIGEPELKEIASKVGTALLPQLEEKLASGLKSTEATTKKAVEEALAKLDKPVRKDGVGEPDGDEDGEDPEVPADDPVAAGLKSGKIDKRYAEMSPAMRFYRQVRALSEENSDELARINKYTLASQLKARKAIEKDHEAFAKSGYANETTAADGAVLVPDAEFVTTVFENLPNYGVAFNEADVRQTDRTAVRVITLDGGLTFYATAEAGVKTSAKLLFSKGEVSLQKYAVIVPATDELTDDAAIDYWNLVTRELTRAYARTADEIVFTHATSGITNQSGVLTHTLGGAGAANLDWDDLLTAQSKTEDDLDESNNKWYMRKETWYALIMKKGTTNDHYIAGSLNTASGWVANPNTPTTPWGTPVVFTRVLPTINSVSANDAVAVYGDLRNYLLYNKRGMQIKMLSEATILDADSAEFNLATQDAQAMRAVVRLLGVLPKGSRSKFVVLGTGTVS